MKKIGVAVLVLVFAFSTQAFAFEGMSVLPRMGSILVSPITFLGRMGDSLEALNDKDNKGSAGQAERKVTRIFNPFYGEMLEYGR